MATFGYTAHAADGSNKTTTGSVEAANKTEGEKLAKAKHAYPVTIRWNDEVPSVQSRRGMSSTINNTQNMNDHSSSVLGQKP